MRRLSYLATLTVVALLLLVAAAGAQPQEQGVVVTPVPEVRTVDIQDYYFDPAAALVKPGTTLMWINYGQEQHTVTADDGSFDSGVMNPGDIFVVTVEGSGTLSYHCTLHPAMTGTVTVEGGAGEPAATRETPPEGTVPAVTPPAAGTAPTEGTTTEEAPAAEETSTQET